MTFFSFYARNALKKGVFNVIRTHQSISHKSFDFQKFLKRWARIRKVVAVFCLSFSTRNLFNRVSMRIPAPVGGFKLLELNLDRQGLSGWQLSAAYTFRF